jgi:hypothetical protein
VFTRPCFRSTLLLTLALTLAAPPSHAQAEEDSLAWESVGQTYFDPDGLFATGVDAEGTGDLPSAVYANGIDGLFVIRPGEEEWTLLADYPTIRASDDTFLTREGTLLANSFQRIQRSTDGGETWVDVNDGGNVAPVYTPGGALLTGYDGHPTDTVTRSTDDGLTWEQIDMGPTLGGRTLPLAFAVLPPSEALPGGRIVAGGNDGLVYSDDDGFSWQPTNVWAAFAFRASAVVLAPWGDPPGTLYAQVNGTATGTVWESADGVEWTEVGQIPGIGGGGANMTVAGDESGGALYAVDDGGTEDIQVYRSGDRGRTWAGTGRIPAEEILGNEVGVRLEELIVGPEGRLWLGISGQGPSQGEGVFRTVEPVFPVSAEGGLEPGKPGAELVAAYPNPSSGAVTVPVVVPKAAEVRVTVYDVLGRAVATLHDGRLDIGVHDLTLDGAALPTGVYLVRAEVSGSGAAQAHTRRITLVD